MSKQNRFKREYFLHRITQSRLKELFNLKFIASEFQLSEKRLDNLAFDSTSNSFVIIEYKNNHDPNVINQAQSYYDLLQDRKEDFLNRLDMNVEVDFDKTRIMIISSEAIEEDVKDYIEVWKVSLCENCKVKYENLKTGRIEITEISKDELELTQDDLLKDKPQDVSELYIDLKDKLLQEFDDLTLKIYVDIASFRVNNRIVCLVNIKESIKIHYFADNLTDADCKIRNISDITTGGLANYELNLNSKEDIDCAINFFKQTYDKKVTE